ncbi:hypothetical protein J4H86_23625 [Spiractinospora alimapuensis]|uniref:hypothetical protein n=1 Tax=Spiractinospora alimapuensis TaxID=2820884 RepID=UPI001F188672|nr:hypothetical protein [Spiractinospora alimapuensis]QVQ51726.1 hypothetical protein J4H86_23625 [Spiractinospora alimapuensis]
MPRPLTIGLLALAGVGAILGAGVGGYAVNALTTSGVAEAAPASGSEEDSAPSVAVDPFGNAAGLSYTRLDGATFLVVVDGAGVAALTAGETRAEGDDVEIAFTSQYLPDEGEYTVRSQDFFHYAHPGGVDPVGVAEDSLLRPAEETDLAVLTPDDPVQEFTVVLPDAPTQGALSYAPEEVVDQGLLYRTPLCYEADGDFNPHREACEDVPDPGGW